MTNLLPPEEKQLLLAEKKQKLAIIWGLIVIIPLVCFILILLSIYFYILGETKSQQVTLEQAQKDYQTPDFLSFKAIIQKSNSSLATLQASYARQFQVNQVLKTVAGISRPQDVYLTNISVKRDDGQETTVAVSGFAGTRDSLLAFQKNLQAEAKIQKVSFSPESWVSSKNATFSLTFQLAP